MTWAGLSGSKVSYFSSESESQRFGIPIGRITVGFEAQDAVHSSLTEVMSSAADDLLIVRWPSDRLSLASAALASGRTIIPADTLTYWEARAGTVGQSAGGAPAPGLACAPATAFGGDPRAAVAEVVLDSFRAYGNHYLANPALDPHLALEGYVSWAHGSLDEDPENVLILALDNAAVGVATLTHDRSAGDLEVMLAGIVSSHQAKGWYQYLFAAIDSEAIERRCKRVIISTQAHNVRAQRAWARMGLRPFAAITTVHALRAELARPRYGAGSR